MASNITSAKIII
uniref:Uncharacterized protein n=1 Tax=Arundo donax TaxID=35708 RepID=A0A0A9BKU2_ARUDO